MTARRTPQRTAMGLLIAVLGLLVLAASVYAIVKTLQSNAPTGVKVVWIVLILLLSPITLIFWFLWGPK